jgi:hypothetical protein
MPGRGFGRRHRGRRAACRWQTPRLVAKNLALKKRASPLPA